MVLGKKDERQVRRFFWFIFIIYLLTVIFWLYGFEIKKSFDIEDVFFEGLYLLAGFLSLLFIQRLKLMLLNIGWGIFTWGLLIDFLDEFTKEPELFDTIIEGLITVIGLIIITYKFYIFYFQQKKIHKKLAYLANHDTNTGSYNRHYFKHYIQQEVERSKRYGHNIGFIMIDIDRFKEINDRFGHQQGDRILKEINQFLKGQLRSFDKVIRYGGDEFLIILPESKEELSQVKERLADEIKMLNKREAIIDFPLTLSIGTALWNKDINKDVESIIDLADKRMYEEKARKNNSRTNSNGV